MWKKVAAAAVFGVMVAAGIAVGYKIATDEELRNSIVKGFKETYASSVAKMSDMSEDVAARAAKVTGNPQVNQDWVAQQWERVGY